MSEASSIYFQARARADEINRDHYDGRMTYEEGEKAVLGLCHTQVIRYMRKELEPYNRLIIADLSLRTNPFSPVEEPPAAKEYRQHVENKWAGVWDQIVNKRF